MPTQFGHFPSPGAVTAIKEKVRIDNSKNLTSNSVVDPDPVVSGASWPGCIQIRKNCTGSGSDLFDKKICINFANFPIRL